MNKIGCTCQNNAHENDDPVSLLTATRESCPVLRKLFIPDDIWDDYQDILMQPPDGARHHPLILGLIIQRRLNVLTAPAHRLLMKGDELLPSLTPQYRKDLRDRWMICKTDPDERHEAYRAMQGKLFELIFAMLLEREKHTITSMEATGGEYDIETVKNQREYVYEVKYLGMENDLFPSILKSLNKKNATYTASPYDRINYVLLRLYEASKKIENQETKHRSAVLILSPFTFEDVYADLKNNWVDWKKPKFFDKYSTDTWKILLDKAKKKYPNIETEISQTMSSIDEVLFFKEEPNYQISKVDPFVL